MFAQFGKSSSVQSVLAGDVSSTCHHIIAHQILQLASPYICPDLHSETHSQAPCGMRYIPQSDSTLLLSERVHDALPPTTDHCLIAVHLHIVSAPPHLQLVWDLGSIDFYTSMRPACTLRHKCAPEEQHNLQDTSLVGEWTLYLL